MQRNAETITKLQAEVKNAIAHDPIVKDREKFNLKDIVIDNSMSIGNIQFSDSAIRKVLNILNVKPKFTEYRKSMSEKDWEMVADRIKKAKGETLLYGELTEQNVITSIHLVNVNKKRDDDMTNSLAVINSIENELRESEIEFSLDSFDFCKESYTFTIELKNESDPIEVSNGESWKTGNRFEFNSLNFKYMPYFERQVCSNGMYGKQFGFRSSVAKQSFNNDKLEKIINKALHSCNEMHNQLLVEYTERLKKTNISVSEFYEHKKWFNRGVRKGAYNLLMEKYFPEEPLYKAYEIPVVDQPTVWKKTADAGINAYNFFNLLTWIASHCEESTLSKEDAIDLKIAASNLFFKENFDLMQLAPKRNVNYPQLVEMN